MPKAPLVFLLLCLSSLVTAAEDIRSRYAYGYDIETSSSGPIIRLQLDQTIYQGVYHPDLKDITVINRDGIEVPFLIQDQIKGSETQQQRVGLPFFPLQLDTAAELESLTIATREDGTIININKARGAGKGGATLYYLIDASAIEAGRIDRLKLSWQHGEETQLFEARLEGSDNLRDWRKVANLVFSRLSFSGYQLLKDEAELNAPRMKYYRLRWEAGEEAAVTNVQVQVSQTRVQAPEYQTLVAGVSGREDNLYYYDTQGYIPISQVNLIPAQDNSVAQIALYSRNSEAEPWQPRGETIAYRLKVNGRMISNDVLRLPPQAARYWKIEVRGKNYLGDQPQLQVQWLPQQLYFLAQGQAPYQLLYGRSAQTRQESDPAVADLLKLARQQDNQPLSLAGLTNLQTLCGSDCLQPQEAPVDWTRYLLWLVIILGVGALGWMSLVLYREMNQ